MDWFLDVVHKVLHIDIYLGQLVQNVGVWSYVLLGGLIFIETGIVIAPFLPGDSLMFAAGALVTRGLLDMRVLYPLLVVAAILGDTLNYLSGRWCRVWVVEEREIRWVKREHLKQAQEFYAKHGSKMIILARFVPILRSFAPFVAGAADMKYTTFLTVNVVGAFVWVTLFLWGGYFFGNIPLIQERFSLFVVGVAAISLLPLLIEGFDRWRTRRRTR